VSHALDPTPLPEGLGIPADDGHQTPGSVRLVLLTLLKRLATLPARWHQHASHASRPPATDAPTTKHQRRSQPPSDGSRAAHQGIWAIRKSCWPLPSPSLAGPRDVPVASESWWS
jgi:hypothetical protein